MAEYRVLISCQLVWDDEARVKEYLARKGVEADLPRFEGQQLEEAVLVDLLPQYDGILAGDDLLTRRALEASPRLKVISKWGIGIDAIDLAAAESLGIEVFNTPGVFGEELADYAMGFILMLARRQHEVNARVKTGDWHKVRGTSLAGKTLGILGLGHSGRALARRGVAAAMKVIGFDIVQPTEPPGCEMDDFDSVLGRADIISLHLPGSAENTHLIDAHALAKTKPGVWLINTSRGSLVDEQALVAALREGSVGAAAIDVFEKEPVNRDNPLLGMENVIVGSHNGSNTREAVERTTWKAVDNLLTGLGVES